MTLPVTLAALRVGPIQFDTPFWLWLIPTLGVLTVWIGRRSLSGMGTTPRRVALLIRLIVIVLLAGAMAEPQWRDEAKDVAVNAILDASRSIPREKQTQAEQYLQDARRINDKPDDRLGLITVAINAYVQSLPRTGNEPIERGFIGAAEGTNLASAIRLGLAIKDQNAAYRIVLITDGNETAGSLLEAAETARAAGVPIDVLPVQYQFSSEVIVDSLVTPATARMGETVNVKVVLDATKPTRGKLNILINGEPVDLDPDTDGLGVDVQLPEGRSVHAVPVKLPRAGPQQFEAVFEAAGNADTVTENNRQLSVTFVTSEGKVLVVVNPSRPEEFDPLVNALTESKIATEVIGPEQLPQSITQLNGYDAIVLVNQAAYDYTQQAQQDLRQYVHDTGGGLVMVGGDQAFGAGGWIGSPLEDALPIKLDPPQKRQMPRGALALVMHSIEMPDGRHYGMKVAEAAVEALSRLDLIGINEYDPRAGGSAWVYKLAEVGDGGAVKRAIKNLTFGDMPDYAPSLQMTLQALQNAEAGARHAIIISDGDAAPPSKALLDQYRKNRITISTVGVYPHGMGDLSRMKYIAEYTGGKFYEVTTAGGLAKIHQIFIKEAQTVKRSLIWEGDPFSPAVVAMPIESMRGITSVAPITGYVVAADREGPVFVTLRGKENDPILASWQHGLGKVVTFTSDATNRWASAWLAWGQFRQFWEQHVRWAMRPSGSAYARVTTEKDGDRTKVVVELIDPSGERVNFARFQGRIATPDGQGADIDLHEVGMGRYEGYFESNNPGSYVVSLRYAAPSPSGTGTTEGSVQAAVSRPFADEFRALTDNTPLLQQVAAMTGGKLLRGIPAADDLWRRDGLTMPVTTIPAWHVFALTGIGLFLMDVGVRRVRIDLRAMGLALAGAVRKSKTKAGEQMDSLRAAREAARQKMSQRAATPEAAADAQAVRETAKASAGVKFEASPDALKRRGGGVDVTIGPPVEKPKAAPGTKTEAAAKEEGLSRLMKAKRRAQDEMGED